jgi:hypothetical protein
MNSVPSAGVRFIDPVLQQFFDDERLGLCRVTVKRLPPMVIASDVQHHVLVEYYDPELEMVKRLSI